MSRVTKKIFILLLLVGCSPLEQSEQDKLRRMNAKGEFIYRNHDEKHYCLETPKHRVRTSYPWESAYVGKLKRITREFFRCKGTQLNPVHIDKVGVDMLHRYDCNGRHSLPIKDQKEFVYPVLIELLNYLQEKLEKRVVITCGHRCPLHNAYADGTPFNQTSKHMIGAEVDFYVLGMEQKPDEVLKVLLQFYRDNPRYKGKKEFDFLRYEKKDTNVSLAPWYNKEILIKIFQKNEGRDTDNRHPYPYLCLQVRHDTLRNERVVFNWPSANNGYLRY